MKPLYTSLFAIALLFILSDVLSATSFRVFQIPNGKAIDNVGCINCHINPQGGGPRNPFGQIIEQKYLNNGDVVWGAALAALDSDGDGYSNGVELQDAEGAWSVGMNFPGDASKVTNPGDASSKPTSSGIENELFNEIKIIVQPPSPNPSTGYVNINYSISETGLVELSVYDISGNTVKTFQSEITTPGNYIINWDASDREGKRVPAGTYFFQLKCNDAVIQEKIIIN